MYVDSGRRCHGLAREKVGSVRDLLAGQAAHRALYLHTDIEVLGEEVGQYSLDIHKPLGQWNSRLACP
ncbi:hypothetical protein ACWDRB_63415 [Nonomuraea sp. NPDC003707]